MNSSAPLFTDAGQIQIVAKQRADLYMRLYQYMAEDFVAHSDMQTYTAAVALWMKNVEIELTNLTKNLAIHTHVLPPHVHAYTDDGNPAITSPSITPTIVLPPVNASTMVWIDVPPAEFVDTTLTVPNYGGNRVVLAVGSEGDAVPQLLRALPIPITKTPLLPPVLAATI